MICSEVSESVAIWRRGFSRKTVREWCMATSFARKMVLVSSTPVASIRISAEEAG